MWLRRAFYGWLIPAAFVLPLWLLIGWGVFHAGGWAFLWVLFLAIPGVFLWQLLLTLLVRARGTVRLHHAVSWWDVLGFGVWHALVIALGFFDPAWWATVLVVAIIAGVGLFWLALWQLWSEAKPTRMVFRTTGGISYLEPMASEPAARQQEVIVLTEKQGPPSA